jgi:hypothetical protein
MGGWVTGEFSVLTRPGSLIAAIKGGVVYYFGKYCVLDPKKFVATPRWVWRGSPSGFGGEAPLGLEGFVKFVLIRD